MDDNGWSYGNQDGVINNASIDVQIYTGGLFGQMDLPREHHMFVANWDCIKLDVWFKSWLTPTEGERILFEVEFGFKMPCDETLSYVNRR